MWNKDYLPGIIYCIILATASIFAWTLYKPISALMWAFALGIVVGNLFRLSKSFAPGLGFCSAQLLKSTVALLGLVTSALIWSRVGIGVVAVFFVVGSAIAASLWLGDRLGLNHRLSVLVAAGTAVCGASAIAALSPAIEAKEEESGLAVSAITLFGLCSMFLYPFLFVATPLGGLLGNNLNAYAVWVGSGIHETAQVVAAAGALGVVAPAMLIKSVRIFLIGPIAFLSKWICCRIEGGGKAVGFAVPIFAVVFTINSLICALLDTLSPDLLRMGLNWEYFKGFLSSIAIPFLFAIAFAAIGSKVQLRKILGMGSKPLLLAAGVAVLAGVIALFSTILLSPLIAI